MYSLCRSKYIGPVKRICCVLSGVLILAACSPEDSPWARGELTIRFQIHPIDGIDPSYQTVIWLEDDSGTHVRSLLVSEYLAFGGYTHEEICPRWSGAPDWENVSREVFDAATSATPRLGDSEISIDCMDAELPPGIYHYFVQTHIVEDFNVLWSGEIEIGTRESASFAEPSWTPQRHESASGILSGVAALYSPSREQ